MFDFIAATSLKRIMVNITQTPAWDQDWLAFGRNLHRMSLHNWYWNEEEINWTTPRRSIILSIKNESGTVADVWFDKYIFLVCYLLDQLVDKKSESIVWKKSFWTSTFILIRVEGEWKGTTVNQPAVWKQFPNTYPTERSSFVETFKINKRLAPSKFFAESASFFKNLKLLWCVIITTDIITAQLFRENKDWR